MSTHEMKVHSLEGEAYREYEWIDPATGATRSYRIADPKELHVHATATTHRVVDGEGVVHSVPSVGQLGCVLRWKPRDPAKPVQF